MVYSITDPATIMLRGLDWSIRAEDTGSGVITPGMLLIKTATVGDDTVGPHGAASTVSQKIFARRALATTGVGAGIDTDYADGDIVRYGYARSGDIVNAILNAGTAITVNDWLVSDGIGGVKTRAAEGFELVVGKALATVADPTTGFARVPLEVL